MDYVDVGGLSHAGKVRPVNEDRFLVARADRRMQILLTNVSGNRLPDLGDATVYAMLVADGVGGAPAGTLASLAAIQVLGDLLKDTPDWIMKFDEESAPRILERTAQRYRQIEEAFIAQAQENPQFAGMGTTLTVACVYGPHAVISHVGHSRAYHFHQGRLERLTGDHTVAQELANAGAIPQEAVARHPFRRTLTTFIGTKKGQARAELHAVPLEDGDRILLCTDGLTNAVSEATIAESLSQPASAGEICQTLVNLALEAGGKDNVTAVLAHYRQPQ